MRCDFDGDFERYVLNEKQICKMRIQVMSELWFVVKHLVSSSVCSLDLGQENDSDT